MTAILTICLLASLVLLVLAAMAWLRPVGVGGDVGVVPEAYHLSVTPGNREAELPALKDRPLLYEARSIYEAPVTPISDTPALPALKFAGSLMVPGRPAIAIITLTTGGESAERKVKKGDQVEGWTVVQVMRDRVVLQYGSEQYEIDRSGEPRPRIASSDAASQSVVVVPLNSSATSGSGSPVQAGAQAPLPDIAPRGRAAALTYGKSRASVPTQETRK